MLSVVWCSHIDSWDKLKNQVIFTEPSLAARNRLRTLTNDDQATYRSLVESFMQGVGVPNLQLLLEAEGHFDNAVDLTLVDEAGYRAKMFCYATTGSFERETDSGKISVGILLQHL